MGNATTVSVWDALIGMIMVGGLSWLFWAWKVRKYKKRWELARKILDNRSIDEILEKDPPPPDSLKQLLEDPRDKIAANNRKD